MNLGSDEIRWQEDNLLNLGFAGTVDDGIPLTDWQTISPGFGCYGNRLGSMETNFIAEVDETDDLGDGTVLTPMLEFGVDDYMYLKRGGQPYVGMQAIGSNGDLYQYDYLPADPTDNNMGGLFKRLRKAFKKVGRKIRKGVKKLKKIAKFPHKLQKRLRKKIRGKFKKLLAKTKFGRSVIKIGGKLHKVWKRKVKPFIKKAGPWMKRLAPVAMAIPGVGPIISKGMVMAGNFATALKVGDAAMKAGKFVDRHSGSVTDMIKTTAKNPKAFVRALKQGAAMIEQMAPQSKFALAKKFDKLAKYNPQKLRSMMPVQAASPASIAAAQKLSRLAQEDNAMRFARNKAKPLAQRKRALSHARQIQAQNIFEKAALMSSQIHRSGRKMTPKQSNAIRAMKIASLKAQLKAMGVRV